MNSFRGGFGGGFNTNTVVVNLLIINIIGFVAAWVFGKSGGGYHLNTILGLYIPSSDQFKPYQLLTHMFMHGNLMHIFFNMYALFLFGTVLERVWGAKRFLIFYLVCGFGAALLHLGVSYWEAEAARSALMDFGYSSSELAEMLSTGQVNRDLPPEIMEKARTFYGANNYPTVGASGAVFGLLLGYGMLFPNSELFLLFIPFPIKAKYFVIGYGLIELFAGFARSPGDNVAHFAHIGGMIFGFILIKIWQQDRDNFY
ncbi:MAG: rhomboid family intramembrane serine protease [Luteibaculum sp.]